MNILLVDDHALVRAGIRTLINQIDSFQVVGEADGVERGLALLRELGPDLVVTDITLGNESGLDLLAAIKRERPATRVVVLSMHSADEVVSDALRLGADAYLLKDSAPGELDIALRAVERHESYLSPVVSRRMIDRYVRPQPVAEKPLDMLTARQKQILTMIAGRKSTKEIAYELDLSEKTIGAHRAQIMERTGVRDLVAANSDAAAARIGGSLARSEALLREGLELGATDACAQFTEIADNAQAVLRLQTNLERLTGSYRARFDEVAGHGQMVAAGAAEVLGQLQYQDIVRQCVERLQAAAARRNALLGEGFGSVPADPAVLAALLGDVLDGYLAGEAMHGLRQEGPLESRAAIELF